MKLIKTNDGLFGWLINGRMIWCDTRSELYTIGWASAMRGIHIDSFKTEVDTAIDIMSSNGDDIAEFGIRGTFMYTTKTEEAA